MLPPSLPSVATTMTRPQIAQLRTSFRRPIFVRRPVNAKNRGSRKTEANSSSRAVR
jgi:hypothetical protein